LFLVVEGERDKKIDSDDTALLMERFFSYIWMHAKNHQAWSNLMIILCDFEKIVTVTNGMHKFFFFGEIILSDEPNVFPQNINKSVTTLF
jgi:hypothetical protein